MTIYCTYCGQGFSRNEHLQRHVLTHTDLRPFECPVCHLTFKRRDLMKKHFIAHDATESHLSPRDADVARSLLVRARSTAACSNCAQTKTKCDNDVKQPCTRCRSKGLACAARTTRPRGPKPRHARPSHNKPQADASSDGADTARRTGNTDFGSPTAERSGEKEALCTARTDGEPGPSIEVASSSLAPATSPWNISTDFSSMPTFDIGSNNNVSGTQRQHACITSGHDDTELPGQQISPELAKMQAGAQSTSNMQQCVSTDQPNVFSQDIFQLMRANNDGSLTYGPSWDLGSTPDQFLNPASEVFGPFLGFPNPPNFNIDAPIVTSPNEDVIMQESEQFCGDQDSCPVLPSQKQLRLSLDSGDSSHIDSDPNDNSKVMATQTPRDDTASPLALDNDPGTLSTTYSTDPWFLPKDVEHWTMLQCCPRPSAVAPGRVIANLAFLEENSRHSPGPWSVRSAGNSGNSGQPASGRFTRVHVSLSSVTRERISAITQSFFPKALQAHGLGITSSPSSRYRASEWFGCSGYILLPPTEDLEVFLENYMNYIEPYFPLVPTRTLDPNELLVASGNEKGATLLLLLMIAIGATCDPATKARRLGAGLAEMCRISLTDLVEKDNEYSTVPLILQCSLLLTIQSCWGGDKWQMDIGAGHRSMYIAMLRNSGYFNKAVLKRPKSGMDGLGLHTAWRTWVEQEGRRRLAYNWVMVDQELSLFYDQPPTFAVTELRAPLPETDEFWLAKTAIEWKSLYDHEHGPQSDLWAHLSLRPQHSLRQLFQLCLANELDAHHDTYRLTPTRLRLLLYPLQILVFHHSQLLDAFPDKQLHSMSSFKATVRTSSILRLDELQCLLQSWWSLAQTTASHLPDHEQPLVRASLILYHLVSLNLYAGIKPIESFARGERERAEEDDEEAHEGETDAEARRRYLTGQCVYAPHDALYHAGQVLRLVRETPLRARPPWWAAAVYRVTLVLWAHSMAQALSMSSLPSSVHVHVPSGRGSEGPPVSGSPAAATTTIVGGGEPTIQIDVVTPTDPAVARFLRHKRGVPVLTTHTGGANGATLRLDNPQMVLQCCSDALEGVESFTWFAMGVRIKLETLLQAWSGLSSSRKRP